ncbi:MAG TPA: DUF5110 domain-containing protein, partial [Chitinophagaceae bacterium]|nr:DUF5110 domain-containing protein [Chitinophagaceae bacterium]
SRRYAASIEKGNNDTLTLDIYPGKRGRFRLVEDDGLSNEYLKGIFATTTIELRNSTLRINPTEGNYNGQSSSRNWIIQFHSAKKPKKVLLNGQVCTYDFNPEQKLITITTGEKTKNKKWKIRLIP